MTPQQWQQVGRLYQAALELEADARPTFLRQNVAMTKRFVRRWSRSWQPKIGLEVSWPQAR